MVSRGDMRRFLESAKRLVRINAVASSGNEEIANYVVGLMRDLGFKTQIQHVVHSYEDISKRQFNAIGILGDSLVDRKTRKGLLLMSHLDTVGPGVFGNWVETGGDPFSLTVKEGKVYGLGSASAKLDFLCKLYAIEKLRERKLKNPIYLVGTCGKEIGMLGAKYLIQSMCLNPRYALIGEPSDLEVIYSHKSLELYRVSIAYQLIEKDSCGFNRKIEIHVYGKSANGAYPHLGNNAIEVLVNFLQKMLAHGYDVRFTSIDGGDVSNKVPDYASSQFYLKSQQLEDFKRFFKNEVNLSGMENCFRIELGGAGDMGVRFLPNDFFLCLTELYGLMKRVELEFRSIQDEGYNPPFCTLNFSRIRPALGRLDLFFDFRLLPVTLLNDLEQKIRMGVEIVVRSYSKLNIILNREVSNSSLDMSIDHELLTVCSDAMTAVGIKPVFTKNSTSTEAAQYYYLGYPAVVFGAGKSQGNSHCPNEENSIEQIQKAISFYEKIIEKMCCV